MLHKSARQSLRFQTSSSSVGSIFPLKCNIQTLLISLVGVWIFIVLFFVIQLSRSPPSYSPPSLFQSNIKKPPAPNIYNVNEIKISQKLEKISQKLSEQTHLTKAKRRIYSDISLPILRVSQPRHIYDSVKKEFKNAEWKPNVEKRSKYKCLYYCDDHWNRDCVLKHIEYWTKPHDKYDGNKVHSVFDSVSKSDLYITFKSDCGGFNNLRQAFEFIIGVSWLTQRTLVFPVTEGWYLIDWGSIKVDPPANESGISNYNLFYDLNHLSMVIPLMNLTQFLYKFQNDKELDLPMQYHIDYDIEESVTEHWEWHKRQAFKKWQNERSLNKSFAVPYGINHNVLLWPSYDDVKQSKTSKFYYKSHPSLDEYIGHRQKREYGDNKLGLNTRQYIHFPSCVNGDMRNYRYLGQVATAIAFADFEMELKYKKLIRDHSHLVPKVFEIASFMISYLGLFEYTSAHIRRNDFQFKNSWISPQKSFKNMVQYFDDGEVIYIASDADNDFFQNVTKQYKQIKAIYRWSDFVDKNGLLYNEFNAKYNHLLDINTIPRKLVHLIEMVIASGAKRFFGTTSSTYSAYISRLRGYIDATDQEIYFHNKAGKYDMDRNYRPTEYMIEFKDMWLDIKDYC